MKPPVCYIVNVGHGNATVLSDTEGVVIIDAGVKQKLLQFLIRNNIKEISMVMISHVDYDHIAGIIDLLMSPEIRISRVLVNTDPSQNSKTWEDITVALKHARKEYGTVVQTELHSGLTGSLDQGIVRIEVLIPDEVVVLRGIGSKDTKGRIIDRHFLNGVIDLKLMIGRYF